MDIAVCCKFVPCVQDMEKRSDNTVSFDRAVWQISDYDLQAIQTGLDIARQAGGKLYAITVGTSAINDGRLKKDLLSRGPDELLIIADNSLEDASTARISELLALLIEKAQVQLVLFGEGSADYYYQQTGLQVGERLGWVCLNGVTSMKIENMNTEVIVDRTTEKGCDTLSLQLPAALTVTSNICVPERPTMKTILSAGKKPCTEYSIEDLGVAEESKTQILETMAVSSKERKNQIIDGSATEAASTLVRCLMADGLL